MINVIIRSSEENSNVWKSISAKISLVLPFFSVFYVSFSGEVKGAFYLCRYVLLLNGPFKKC